MNYQGAAINLQPGDTVATPRRRVTTLSPDVTWTDMPMLRWRCEMLSEHWGDTIFPVHTIPGQCKLMRQPRFTRTRDRLTDSLPIVTVRAIVEWELAKAQAKKVAA